MRINALLCLPVRPPEIHEFRRRLAVSFFYDDPTLSRHHPDDIVTIKSITERLSGGDFCVGPNTDFAELRARILLLDIVVDDGSFIATDDPDDEKKFNADVDELAYCLREIWRKINDAGMKIARTEVKSVIEWVQQRLLLSVRTKRKAKAAVFDMLGDGEDTSRPRQQEFMKLFLKRKVQPATTEDEDTTVSSN